MIKTIIPRDTDLTKCIRLISRGICMKASGMMPWDQELDSEDIKFEVSHGVP